MAKQRPGQKVSTAEEGAGIAIRLMREKGFDIDYPEPVVDMDQHIKELKDLEERAMLEHYSSAKNSVLECLREEKRTGLSSGIYQTVQIDLTYNSNRIEGSGITHEQTQHIFEASTVDLEDEAVSVDDIVETANHFRCIDYIIDNANRPITEHMIKHLHELLKNGTSDSRKSWFAVGDYKKLPNEVGGKATIAPENVAHFLVGLIERYENSKAKTLEDLVEFHYEFESIHPFQDGNGRVGRLLLFKECLRHNIVPFIIEDKNKMYYYRGLSQWEEEKGFLLGTCLSAQDDFKASLDYFDIPY